ncbi:MAG: hypothetical protein HKN08_12650 [Gammaproteobacteria bacterium]|nr:hypothetical protein [Gammaproteobacteria bacterium]
MFQDTQLLAAAICRSATLGGMILGEQVTRIGRRNAYEKTGRILLETLRRII